MKKFELNNTNITNEALTSISVNCSAHLESISVNHCYCLRGASSLINIAERCPKLRRLQCCSRDIGVHGLQCLLRALYQNTLDLREFRFFYAIEFRQCYEDFARFFGKFKNLKVGYLICLSISVK